MGKGIASEFRARFGRVSELREQKLGVGDVGVLEAKDRYIYYLVTKDRCWEKPSYKTLKSALVSMKRHCVSRGVTSLAMPRIGCGLDKLEWRKVSKLIQCVFECMDIKIYVYVQ